MFELLFCIRLELIFLALLLLIPLVSWGWPRPLAALIGNLVKDLHHPRDLLSASALFMIAAWSAMFTSAWVHSICQARLCPDLAAGQTASIPDPIGKGWPLIVFASIGLVGVFALIFWARGPKVKALLWCSTGFLLAAVPLYFLGEGFFKLGQRLISHPNWPAWHGWAVWTGLWLLAGYILLAFAPRKRGLPGLPSVSYVLVLWILLLWWVSWAYVKLGAFFPATLLLLAWALLPGFIYRKRELAQRVDHIFRVVPRSPQTQPLTARQALKNRNGNLVVLCATGGGIQAAGWATWVYRQMLSGRPRLKQEIGLVSGVSGGGLGLAFVLQGLHLRGQDADAKDAFRRSVRSSLASAAYGLAYPGFLRFIFFSLPQLLFPRLRWSDRGNQLEKAWQINSEAGQDTLLGDLEEGIGQGRLPLPVLSATLQASGERVMITPLRFAPSVPTCRARTMDEVLAGAQGALDLSIWTAARLSSSFPYVSPAARAATANGKALEPEGHRLLDGGYSDNNGIASALDCLDELLAVEGHGVKRIALALLDPFPAGALSAFEGTSRGWSEWLVQYLGPPQTAIRALFRSQEDRNKREVQSYIEKLQAVGIPCQAFRFVPGKGVPAPLSWHLTPTEIENLKKSWLKGCNENELGRMIQFLER